MKIIAGSWWATAGKLNHRDGCSKDSVECVIFIRMEKGFSAHPMTADGKPAPKAAAPAKADAAAKP